MATSPTALPILRRSAIEAAGHCLYRYRKIWVEGVDDMSDYALRGIAFHACAHRYILRLVEAQLPADAEEAETAFLEGIASVGRVPGRLVTEVRELFDRWAEHFELELPWFLAAEERQERSDQAFTPDLVYARPDCLEIIDFKTFWHGLTEAQAKADFQAQWYLRNAMIEWPGFPQYRFTFAFVRLGTTLSIPYTPDMLPVLSRQVAAVQAAISEAETSGEWPATPGPACGYCELRCPAVDQPVNLPKRLLTQAHAEQLGGWILAGEQMVRVAKKALKTYCASHGPISIKGVVWANRPRVERRYPIDQVLDILKRRSIFGAFDEATQRGLTISHSALAPLFKQFPALEDDLASIVQEKETWRFSAQKPGGEDEEDEA
jgi:hypothetical protein